MSESLQPHAQPSSDRDFTVKTLAYRKCCSSRHIHRMLDAGLLPTPCRLGHLLRWPAAVIIAWEKEGCPSRKGAR